MTLCMAWGPGRWIHGVQHGDLGNGMERLDMARGPWRQHRGLGGSTRTQIAAW